MIKEDELRDEITKLLDAHINNEIDSKDEWYREMVYFRDVVVKKLNIHIVSNRYSEKDMDDAYDKGFKDGNQRDFTI